MQVSSGWDQATPAASTITAILSGNEMLDAEESPKHSPMQRFEMANGLLYQPLTVIDDHSRFRVGLKACPDQHSRAVREHLRDIFGGYDLPERMLLENGRIWKGFHTKLTFGWLRLGIHHPQTQGNDERLHPTLKPELLIRQPFYDLDDCQSQFDAWRNRYNDERPHPALDMQQEIFSEK